MNENQEIPNGWALTSIQDIADVIMGQSPPSDTYNKDEIGIPFFQGKAEFSELHPIVDKWCSKPNKIAKNNDILLSVRAPVGATNLADRKCCIGRGLAAIRYPHDYKFLYHYFCSIEEELDKKGTGTTFKAISGDVIRNTKLHLPPLPEQHRIVAKIEELFSSLDRGIESLKTAQQHLKVYRQAVLKWAFEGKLTNNNVKEGELPEGWKWVLITDLVGKNKHALKAGPFGSSLKKEFYVKKGYKIYGQEQVISGDPFYGDYYVNEDKYQELYSNRIKPLDVLISLVGTVGKVLILPENCAAGIINPRLIKISLDTNVYLPKFFKYYFESSSVKSFYSSKAQGTTMDVLNLSIIKKIKFPLCSLSEQQTIVAEIESRLSVCDKIEESIEQSLIESESLRQSILKKAFEGKLVPQDPNDEPAAKLLERIKAEKVNDKLSKKGGTRKG